MRRTVFSEGATRGPPFVVHGGVLESPAVSVPRELEGAALMPVAWLVRARRHCRHRRETRHPRHPAPLGSLRRVRRRLEQPRPLHLDERPLRPQTRIPARCRFEQSTRQSAAYGRSSGLSWQEASRGFLVVAGGAERSFPKRVQNGGRPARIRLSSAPAGTRGESSAQWEHRVIDS
jgi:hypothetical protein